MDENKNENQEKSFPKRLKKLLSKFRIKDKRTRTAGMIYGALALVMVAATIITVSNMKSDIGEIDVDYSISVPDVSTVKEESKESKKTDTSKEQSEVPTVHDESEVPASTKTLYVRPVSGEVVKEYTVTSLVWSETMKDYRTHSGVDIAGNIGDSVLCYSDGYVSEIKSDALMGKTVIVTHVMGLKSKYQNLADTLPDNIKVGAEVKCGDILGAIGDTAIIESGDVSHLHFELTVNGKTIDAGKELRLITN